MNENSETGMTSNGPADPTPATSGRRRMSKKEKRAMLLGAVVPVGVYLVFAVAGLTLIDTSRAPDAYLSFLALTASAIAAAAAGARVYGHLEKAHHVDLAGKWGAFAVAVIVLGSSAAYLGIDIVGSLFS